MEYGLSTRLFTAERLSSRLLDRIFEAGFRQIEIFGAPEHLNYRDAHHVRDVAQWFSDLGIALHSLHAPPYSEPGSGRRGGFAISVAYTQRRLQIDSMDEIKRTLEAAERLPFRFLVLHLGLENDEYGLDRFDAAFTSLEHLRIFAKERGVTLLLENAPGEINTPTRLVEFLDYTHLRNVGICFDAGHAHLAGNAREAFGILRERVSSVHLHDNHGEKDDHLLPFEGGPGGIDWPGLMLDLSAAKGSSGESPCAFLELQDHGPKSTQLKQVCEVARKLEELEQRAAGE
ncbi:MAG TPA: sugar phosphate isomerase/epimerase family protein [Terriglobia bacterium]|nr:sugar phosphate isomerase/epimerase family protein [Terriglobia bacterium]